MAIHDQRDVADVVSCLGGDFRYGTVTELGLAVESGKGHLENSQRLTENNAVHQQWTYTSGGRQVCQDFSFSTPLEDCELPTNLTFGDRLKAEIERLGLSYNEFGARVALEERPPRETPYRRNNVEHWVSSRRRPNQYAWAAIERVTGKTLGWFLHGDLPDFGERPARYDPIATQPPPKDAEKPPATRTRKGSR